jgi:hypothetical protein
MNVTKSLPKSRTLTVKILSKEGEGKFSIL